MKLTETGERIDIVGQPATHTERQHLARYAWAAEQVEGDVLDVACGTGYGSAFLAERGVRVVGLDRVPEAISFAAARCPEASFVVGELPLLPFRDATFDGATCFETIEHIDEDRLFLSQIARVLRPTGTLLLSTPNRESTSPDGVIQNQWHVHEYALDELRDRLITSGFEEPEVFCQSLPVSTFVGRQALRVVARFPILCRPGRWWDELAHGDDSVEPWTGGVPSMWVLRARKA